MPTGSCARKGAAAQACPWSVARAYAPTEHYTRAYLLALTRHVHLCLPCTCTRTHRCAHSYMHPRARRALSICPGHCIDVGVGVRLCPRGTTLVPARELLAFPRPQLGRSFLLVHFMHSVFGRVHCNNSACAPMIQSPIMERVPAVYNEDFSVK